MRQINFKRAFRLRTLLFAVVFFLLLYMPLFGFPRLRRLAPDGMSPSQQYQGIISIWNVDTFEGGTYSREAMLNEFARGFEQQNKGIFILANNFTPDELEWQLTEGNRPDIISFGAGAGGMIKGSLRSYGGRVSVRDDIAAGGRLGGMLYAVPWCMGGYAVFSTDNSDFDSKIYTGGKYTLPLAAYIKNDLTVQVEEYGTQYEAYEQYSKRYEDRLLGTQRDAYRLGLKLDQNKISELNVSPLGGYTDLVQYLGIFDSVPDNRVEICQAFIEYVTSDASQKKIEKLSMFSTCGIRLYSGGSLGKIEEAIASPLRVLNAFTSIQVIEEYKNLCQKAIGGDNAAKKTIKGL